MIIALLLSFIVSIALAFLLSIGFKRRAPGPVNGFLFIALVIFMFTFTIGGWLMPVGPEFYGINWFGYIIVATLMMFLLGAVLPRLKPRNRIINKSELDKEIIKEKTMNSLGLSAGLFLWIMTFAFIVIALVRFFIR